MRTLTVVTGVLIGVLQAACGDSTEAGGAFTEEERTALITALGLDTRVVHDWAVGTIVDLAPEVGRMGQYDGLGSQARITFWDGTSPWTYGFTRVDGWTDFNSGAGTVSSAVTVDANFMEEPFPASISTIVHPEQSVWGEMRAYYTAGSTSYVATEGEFNLGASGFDDFENCPEDPPEDWDELEFVSCRYAFGTIAGSFRFDAVRLHGTGDATLTQPSLSFELPAVRLEIELRRSDGASPSPATHLFER